MKFQDLQSLKYIYSPVMFRPLKKQGSSFFDLCLQCDERKSESQISTPVQSHTPLVKKYTHAMISPKASLKDLQRKKMQRLELLKSPKSKNVQIKTPTPFQPTNSCTSKSDFKGFFKKEQRVGNTATSVILGPQIPKEKKEFKVLLAEDPIPLKPVFSYREEPLMKQAMNPKHSVQFAQIRETPHRVHHLDKTINPTQASSRHGLHSDPRISRYSQRPFSNYPTLEVQLGSSRFTVMSEEEEESPKTLKMEESAILVNVFNPTDSQLQKWSLNKRKLSSLNASKLSEKVGNSSKKAKFASSLSQIITDI